MYFDAHTHIFSPEVVQCRESFFSDPHFKAIYANPKARLIDHTALIAAMDQAGIERAILMGFPWSRPDFVHHQNQYLYEVQCRYPDRLYAFGSLAIPLRINLVDAEIRAIKALGLYGIGEVAFYAEGINKKTVSLLAHIFQSASACQLPVCLHVNEPVGHHYPGKGEFDSAPLYTLIRDYPALTLILAHWGGGLFFYELMPDVAEALSRVYYDTAASPYLYRDDVYSVAISIVGSRKVLWGSDYPLIAPHRYIDAINAKITDPGHRSNILYDNIFNLLNIKNY